MTPAARDAAAIDLLDRWLAGEPAEAALTRWARGARYAGSSDREAVRDLVFGAIRRARSALALGGAAGDILRDGRPRAATPPSTPDATGRAMVLGLLREAGQGLPAWSGDGHGPAPLTPTESALMAAPPPGLTQGQTGGLTYGLTRGQALDMPDWLLPHLDASLGADADAVAAALRDRAPVFVRVHAGRCTPAQAIAALERDGITARAHPLSPWALELTAGARRLRHAAAFAQGLVEPQDAASQAVVACFAAALPPRGPVLDLCAGGGGKSLALAALGHPVTAHDADPARMRDLPARATRAGTPVAQSTHPRPGWAAVLADVPCSGSGSWRRAPEGKWALTPARLDELGALQGTILAQAAALVGPGGVLGYATCSLLGAENHRQIDRFLGGTPGWRLVEQRVWTPLDGGDGFYLAVLRRV